MAGSGSWRLLVVMFLTAVELPALHSQQIAGRAVAAIPASMSAVYTSKGPSSSGEPSENSALLRRPGFIQQLTRSAGIVFAGRVASVARAGAFSGGDGASTVITFEVEHALLGAVPGQILTIREWAGHWENGEHYRVGERVLLFLFPPGKSGLTSAVGGPLGKFALDHQGRVLLNPRNVAELVNDPNSRGNAIPYADFVHAIQLAMASGVGEGNQHE